MTLVEFLTLCVTIISTVCLPTIFQWLKNKSENRSLNSEQLKLGLENAKEFQEIKKNSRDPLVKDRSAKKTFNNVTLTFEEVDFFSKYINTDYWVIEYLKVKTQLKAIRDNKNRIIGFDKVFTDSDIKKNIFWYLVYAIVFSLPFIFIEKSKLILIKIIHQEAYLILLFFIAFYMLLLVGIVTTLTIGRKQTSAKIFINELSSNALVRMSNNRY